MNDQLADSHYQRRLLSSIFGNWISFLRESVHIIDESEKVTDNYLAQKLSMWERNDSGKISKRYSLTKWINFCNRSLRRRGQYLLGKIAREKILIAIGYQRLRQFFVDEKLLQQHGILPLRSQLQYNNFVAKFQQYLQRKRQKKFLHLMFLKYRKKINFIRRLCSSSCSLMWGPAREAIRRWRVRSRKSNSQMIARQKAIHHYRSTQLSKGLYYLRSNRQRSHSWRQLYDFCDSCHYRFRVGNQGMQTLLQRYRQNRSFYIPRMYKALVFWKNLQGNKVFHIWRAHVSDKVFRIRSNRKLDDFNNRKRMKSCIIRLKEYISFRKEARKYNYVKVEESYPQMAFYAKLRSLLNWQSRIKEKHKQQRMTSYAQKFSRKVAFHKFIFHQMNEIYFPVVLRRQAAYWRRAIFHDGARKLSNSFTIWKQRLANTTAKGFLCQRDSSIEALIHWKSMKLRQGLRSWYHFSRQRTAFRFVRRQALLQAQPSFQRQRLLSRCFNFWRTSTLNILRLKRQRIRQQYHLSPSIVKQNESKAEIRSFVAPQLILPISAEVKQLKDQVRNVLSQPADAFAEKPSINKEQQEEIDLARAVPKPLTTSFPSLPSDVKYGMVAAVSSLYPPYHLSASNSIVQQIPVNSLSENNNVDLYEKLPPWVMSMSVASSVSSIASSHYQNIQNNQTQLGGSSLSHQSPFFKEDKPHWSEYIHRDLPRVQGHPLPDNIASALKIFKISHTVPCKLLSSENKEMEEEDQRLAREPPRDGNYRPNNSCINPRVINQPKRNQFDSGMSTVSHMSSMLPATNDLPVPITLEYMHRFLDKIQHIDPIKFKSMLKNSPEKRRIFLEIRKTLRLMYAEELQLSEKKYT